LSTVSNSVRARLWPIIQSKDPTGIFIDFDGTLAEFAVDTAGVTVSDDLQILLEYLPALYAVVAIVSSREVMQIAAKVHSRSVRLSGLNGAEERLADGVYRTDPELQPWMARAQACARTMRTADPLWRLLGMTVEAKLTTVSLHYRAARWERLSHHLCRLVGWIARQRGFASVLSQMELEIQPRVSMNKGEWVKRTIRTHGLRAAVYVGDGDNDLRAYAAIRQLLAAGVLRHAACFAVDGKETPRAVLDSADDILPGIPGVTSLLELLAGKGRDVDS
jgi:trehalose-phosphatase